jgi:hypothetical protein
VSLAPEMELTVEQREQPVVEWLQGVRAVARHFSQRSEFHSEELPKFLREAEQVSQRVVRRELRHVAAAQCAVPVAGHRFRA